MRLYLPSYSSSQFCQLELRDVFVSFFFLLFFLQHTLSTGKSVLLQGPLHQNFTELARKCPKCTVYVYKRTYNTPEV